MKKSEPRAGLTLAELLIAMVISAMVVTLLAQGLGVLSKWSGSMGVNRVQMESRSSLFRFLHERINRIEPIVLSSDDGRRVLFEGDASQVRLVVGETQYPSLPGLYEQALLISRDRDGLWQLSLSRQSLHRLDEFGTRPMPDALVLYRGREPMGFSFQGEDGWQEQWPSGGTMPLKIRFELAGWPAFSVKLPAGYGGLSLEPLPEEDGETDEE